MHEISDARRATRDITRVDVLEFMVGLATYLVPMAAAGTVLRDFGSQPTLQPAVRAFPFVFLAWVITVPVGHLILLRIPAVRFKTIKLHLLFGFLGLAAWAVTEISLPLLVYLLRTYEALVLSPDNIFSRIRCGKNKGWACFDPAGWKILVQLLWLDVARFLWISANQLAADAAAWVLKRQRIPGPVGKGRDAKSQRKSRRRGFW